MASRPQVPIGLTAELAKDSRLKAAGKQGVLLIWNAPPKPPGSPVSSYRIERKVMGEDEDEWVEQEAANTAGETHYTDRDEPVAGEMRYYRVAATNRLTDDAEGVSDWSNVIRIPIAEHTHNAAPMSVGTIAAQTVTAGQSVTVDVAANFSDADGDTLTYTAVSDMTSYATVSVSGSMVTITGVAAGMATVTVTATDAAGAYAMQTIMVTVEAADTTLGAPGGVMTSDATASPGILLVKVDWTPGDNAVGHLVMLFTDDWQGAPLVEGTPAGNSHTFTVDAGSYIAVVVAYDAGGNIQLTISGVTTVGGGS